MLRRIAELTKELRRLEKDSEAAVSARASLPAGTPRARVTTANARWKAIAERREAVRAELKALKFVCPNCGLPLTQHENESYGGEMWECRPCGFMSYDDNFDKCGNYQKPINEPF